MSVNNTSIKTQFEDLEKRYKEVPKRKWEFRIATLIFMITTIFMTLILSIAHDNAKEKITTDYLESHDYETLITLFDNMELRGSVEAYKWYEKNFLGIDNNTALSGISRNCDANLNSINNLNGVEAYSDKFGRIIICVDDTLVSPNNDKVSEIIVTPKNVYYLDEDDNNSIHAFNIASKTDSIFTENAVNQFAIYGNYLFYLEKGGILKQKSLDGTTDRDVVNNVQRFYIMDAIYVQNGTKISKISFDGMQNSAIMENALLVGVDENHVYFTNFGISATDFSALAEKKEGGSSTSDEDKNTINVQIEDEIQNDYVLYAMNFEDNKMIPIDGRNSFIRAIYFSDDGITVDTID